MASFVEENMFYNSTIETTQFQEDTNEGSTTEKSKHKLHSIVTAIDLNSFK